MVVTQVETFVKTHLTVHLKAVHFLLCILYLSLKAYEGERVAHLAVLLWHGLCGLLYCSGGPYTTGLPGFSRGISVSFGAHSRCPVNI